jgi:hypothetical protein
MCLEKVPVLAPTNDNVQSIFLFLSFFFAFFFSLPIKLLAYKITQKISTLPESIVPIKKAHQ